MLRKLIFGTPSPENDNESPAVPDITVTLADTQPATGLHRSQKATLDLAALDDEEVDDAIHEEFMSTTVIMVRSFASVSGKSVEVSGLLAEHRAASAVLPMRKGYELEEPSIFIAGTFQHTLIHDDAEESSSDYDVQPVKQDKLAAPSPSYSGKNSTDPDSLENIWNRKSPK